MSVGGGGVQVSKGPPWLHQLLCTITHSKQYLASLPELHIEIKLGERGSACDNALYMHRILHLALTSTPYNTLLWWYYKSMVDTQNQKMVKCRTTQWSVHTTRGPLKCCICQLLVVLLLTLVEAVATMLPLEERARAVRSCEWVVHTLSLIAWPPLPRSLGSLRLPRSYHTIIIITTPPNQESITFNKMVPFCLPGYTITWLSTLELTWERGQIMNIQ